MESIIQYSTSNKFIQWASFICTTWASNIFPYWIQKSPYFFRIGRLGASAFYYCFSTIKAVDRKKYPNKKNTTSNKRNVKLLYIYVWVIYMNILLHSLILYSYSRIAVDKEGRLVSSELYGDLTPVFMIQTMDNNRFTDNRMFRAINRVILKQLVLHLCSIYIKYSMAQ